VPVQSNMLMVPVIKQKAGVLKFSLSIPFQAASVNHTQVSSCDFMRVH
jgi:hypothetical protein